jgi:tetratricopeptide (TPR) repeat protein
MVKSRRLKLWLSVLGGGTVIILAPLVWQLSHPSDWSSQENTPTKADPMDLAFRVREANLQPLAHAPLDTDLRPSMPKASQRDASSLKKNTPLPQPSSRFALDQKATLRAEAPASRNLKDTTEDTQAAKKSAGSPFHPKPQASPTDAPASSPAGSRIHIKAYQEVLPSAPMPVEQTGSPSDVSEELSLERLQPAARLYRKAQQYHRQNRIPDAIALYQEVLKLRPGHLDAQINLASALIQRHHYAYAYRLALDTAKQAPQNDRVQLNLAIAEIGLGQPEKALTRLVQAEKRHSGPWFELLLHRGVAYSHLGRLEMAQECYEKARQLNPKDPQVLFNLAIINDKSAHYPEAVFYYQQYISVHQDLSPAEKKRINHRIRVLRAYLASKAKTSSNR